MAHILITDLREIRYMAYVPEEPKIIDCAITGFGKPGTNSAALLQKLAYKEALEKAKRESVPLDREEDRELAIKLIRAKYMKSTDSLYDVKPGIYQVPVEVEVVECCGHDSCPVDAGCEHCKEPVKVARLKSSEPKEESQEELWGEAYLEIVQLYPHPIIGSIFNKLKSKFTITRKRG